MPITNITDKIIADAAKKAEHVVDGAQVKAQKIEKRLGALKKEIAEENRKGLEKALSENERRVVSAANQEVKLQRDNAKRDEINEVFDIALKDILSLPDKEYKTLLKGFLANVPDGTEGEVFAPKEKVAVTKEALKEVGLRNTVTPTDKFKGGITIIEKDYEYNLTFENVLADKKTSLEVEVAKILFD